MAGSRTRHRNSSDSELTRDELYVAEGSAPEEWRRNNALFEYRLIKRTGWIGRLYAILVVGSLALVLLYGAWNALRSLAG